MIILPIDSRIADRVAAGRGTTYARQMPAFMVIVTDAARSDAHVLRNPVDLSRMDREKTTPQDGNTFIRYPRLT